MSATVRILNHLPGGRAVCGHKHALRYLKQGRAVLHAGTQKDPQVIRFIESDHRHKKAAFTLAELLQHRNYDHGARNGVASIEQIQGLPVAGDAWKALTLGTTRFVKRALPRGPVLAIPTCPLG